MEGNSFYLKEGQKGEVAVVEGAFQKDEDHRAKECREKAQEKESLSKKENDQKTLH